MELAAFGLGLVLLILGWHFVWLPTTLDIARDRLFDLREEVRDTFLKNGWGLDSPAYAAIRNFINGQLRFTRHYSFFALTNFLGIVAKNKELQEYSKNVVYKRFQVDAPEIDKYVTEMRERSFSIMVVFMVESSVIAITLVVLTGIAMATRALWKAMTTRVTGVFSMPISRTAIIVSAFISGLATINHTPQTSVRTVVEELSIS